jgi:hypothetical protein
VEQFLAGDELDQVVPVENPREYMVKIELVQAELFSVGY